MGVKVPKCQKPPGYQEGGIPGEGGGKDPINTDQSSRRKASLDAGRMEQTCEEIDEMFSNLLGEMDLLTQSLGIENDPPKEAISKETEMNFSFGFKDLNESLNALEDNDLDALMADLVADCKDAELKVTCTPPFPNVDSANYCYLNYTDNLTIGSMDDLSFLPPPPPSAWEMDLPPPPPDPEEPKTQDQDDSKAKADKIMLALDKMKEAKVKKLIVKVHMTDSSTKTLMVDERQTVREILDNLFEKTHCDFAVEWCLYEENPELQTERFFEDHENIVEILSDWTRDSENKIYFVKKSEKYALFKNPQMKVHFAFHLEIKVPESGGRVERPQSKLLEV
ncbi:unnamed protein product [Ranitomeya imitator]|uniref:Ras-associating domain-containing protein n=1 Tax=Ranitomeya imitator TaxID=111125 RepID=A0ABN9MB13_9NEOB|nr:unnamed protein product [Ranitomeya imitator]